MHNCEEFRERITEHIIDREDLTSDPRFRSDLLICSACCEFYVDSREMMNALAAVDAAVTDEEWRNVPIFGEGADCVSDPRPAAREAQVRQHAASNREAQARQREALKDDRVFFVEFQERRPAGEAQARRRAASIDGRAYRRRSVFALPWVTAAAAALLLITVGLTRLPQPVPVAVSPAPGTLVETPLSLDPVTVDFLQQSELLLRNVVKMQPSDTENLADVKRMASEQLLAIDQRKDAAAQLPPVLNVMDTYETVLRDIRNVDEKRAVDDVPDIQSRIERNGLFAIIKSFQPRVTTVSYSGR
jgi:hypothetical protein